ncbi:MAG TPA: BLUF domain-containing protein [Candidatus Baltobacteraceae bacterium]|nr:BLUF domain-containing protein [Candidatus Baltobacteraceae bacterium]
MASLFQIVYASTASESFDRAALKEMLKGSVQRNTQAGITGLLLYKDGCFMQALEGEEPVVKKLFGKICRDPRHHRIIPLIHEPIKQRHFPNSAMAFRDLDSAELRELPGYSEFMNTPLNGELYSEDISKCQRLLLLFKKNMR